MSRLGPGRLLAVAVTVVAVAILLLGASSAVPATRTLAGAEAARRHHAANARFSCIEAQLRSAVPAGASVAVVAGGVTWRQRLTELATPGLSVTTDPRKADYLLDVATRRTGKCDGYVLLVVPG